MVSMESLGHYLKVQRKLRGITLSDVSAASKVAPNWLVLLENDAFDKLPGEIFTKGYLRLYAECLGLDADDGLLRYEAYAHHQEEIEILRQTPLWRRPDVWRTLGLLLGFAAILYWAITRFACAPQLIRHI